MVTMKKLDPFLYWLSFEDNNNDLHFYQTIILASSESEAKTCGDKMSERLHKSGEACAIHTTWIEEIGL
jgi:hypothetical protein